MQRRLFHLPLQAREPVGAPLLSRREYLILPVFQPRTRLVNFRLSEEEFQQLKETCARRGARSVSDFARASVLASGDQEPLRSLSQRWDRLEARLNTLLPENLLAENLLAENEEVFANHG